jgi:hypothetical protein
MNANKLNSLKWILLPLIALMISVIFYKGYAPASRILNIQNYFITVSGIISGIVIAYLASKLFNLKQERELRQREINKYSIKLTHFRRILYCIMHSHEFWKYRNQVDIFKEKYPGLNFELLHDQNIQDKKLEELANNFLLKNTELNYTTIDLFLAMESIYGDPKRQTWIYDRTIHFNYSLEDLYRFMMPSNQIWYFLEGRYAKHTEGQINDQGIWVLFKDNLRDYISQIDSKFKDKKIDRHLLADLGTEFYSFYLPKMIELTELNQAPLPKTFLIIFWNLIVIFVIGVILPLFIQSLDLWDKWNVILTLSSVGIIIVAFFNLLFDFYKVMNEEIRPT